MEGAIFSQTALVKEFFNTACTIVTNSMIPVFYSSLFLSINLTKLVFSETPDLLKEVTAKDLISFGTLYATSISVCILFCCKSVL